jgi:hypothetical protein
LSLHRRSRCLQDGRVTANLDLTRPGGSTAGPLRRLCASHGQAAAAAGVFRTASPPPVFPRCAAAVSLPAASRSSAAPPAVGLRQCATTGHPLAAPTTDDAVTSPAAVRDHREKGGAPGDWGSQPLLMRGCSGAGGRSHPRQRAVLFLSPAFLLSAPPKGLTGEDGCCAKRHKSFTASRSQRTITSLFYKKFY